MLPCFLHTRRKTLNMGFELNSFWRRLATGFALTTLTVALAACGGSDDDNNTGESRVASLKLIGTASIPTGTLFEGVEFGGISGLDQATDGSYWAISDDRGGERGTPRFYNLSIDYAATGPVTVKVNRQTHMQREYGSSFPASARTVDPEAIRLAPNGNLYWSSEGNWGTTAATLFQPFVREMTTAGKFVREFKMPALSNFEKNTVPPVSHPLVRVHPDGRRSLFITANAGSEISGMPLDEGQALHRQLVEHVSRPEFCYFHKWKKGDLVVWDNRTTLHKAEVYDMARYRRVFRRTTLAGDGPVLGPYSPVVLSRAKSSTAR